MNLPIRPLRRNILPWLRHPFTYGEPGFKSIQYQGKTMLPDLDEILAPIPPKSKGRVIKQTRHSEFNPNPQIRGGRIVKVMPRQLQKIKAAQEMVEDDDGPKLEDLDD